MPYCTIEEAWSQSFNPDSEENTSDFKPYDEKYVPNKDVDLEPSNLYNEDGEKIACTKKMVVKKRVPNMSRTYNRLPEHTGNPSRFNDENGKKRLVISNKKRHLDDSNKYPNYMNSDLPINKSNYNLYEELDDEYRKNNREIEQSSMMEDFKNIEQDTISYYREDDEIKKLRKENESLKNIIEELKSNKNDDKDSILDLLVFIFSGIMIILMMENFTKLVRKI